MSDEQMFNVTVEGKTSAVFDTADEAVRYAMHHVYLAPYRFQEVVDTLNQGQVFKYCYGFNEAHIVPVAKRRMVSLHINGLHAATASVKGGGS